MFGLLSLYVAFRFVDGIFIAACVYLSSRNAFDCELSPTNKCRLGWDQFQDVLLAQNAGNRHDRRCSQSWSGDRGAFITPALDGVCCLESAHRHLRRARAC